LIGNSNGSRVSHVVELVLQVDAAFAVPHGIHGDQLEVHLVRGVLRAHDGVTRLGHVVELADEDGREAALDMVVDFGLTGVKLEAVLALGIDLDVEEEKEARNLLAHAVNAATAHDADLLFGGEGNRTLEVEAVQLVSCLEHLQGKVHLLGVVGSVVLRVEFRQVHHR